LAYQVEKPASEPVDPLTIELSNQLLNIVGCIREQVVETVLL